MNKGGKFLKKLWCCIGGEVKQGNLVLSTELLSLIGHHKEFQSWSLEYSPLSEQTRKGLTLQMSALKLFEVANLRHQLIW